jgi:hypothetical protein
METPGIMEQIDPQTIKLRRPALARGIPDSNDQVAPAVQMIYWFEMRVGNAAYSAIPNARAKAEPNGRNK